MSSAFIVLCMIFCHIVDDYYLQGWLASAKQKSWWEENAPQELYEHDYIWALLMAKLKAAQAEIDIAKAEAEAIKIAAEAEAEANRIIEASLTDGIIEKILADSWDGELPKVVGGEGGYMLPTNILG